MTPQVQHDPRTKQQIKDALYEYLYEPVNKAFERRLDEIINKNCLAQKLTHKSFMYKGVLYTADPPPYPRKANRLTHSLQPEMQAYLAEVAQVNEQEMPYVMGFITQVLNASNDFEDYLAIFPDALHRPIREFIQACPCRNKHLTPADITALQTKNDHSLALLKGRLVTNLII